MSAILQHTRASAKANGPDATQIQPSDWNDAHKFVGGADGMMLVRGSAAEPYGARWQAQFFFGGHATAAGAIALEPGYGHYVISLQSASGQMVVHGAAPSSGSIPFGTHLVLINRAPGTALLVHQSASGPAGGKFLNRSSSVNATHLAGSVGGAAGGTAEYVWDASDWILVSHEQGRLIGLGFSAANCVGFTPGSIKSDFYLHGSDARLRISVKNATIPAGVGNLAITGFPFTFVDTSALLTFFGSFTPAHTGYGNNSIVLGGPNSLLLYAALGAWTPLTGWEFEINVTIPIG